MKTVNAIWEKRNLGVNCTEFVIENETLCEEDKKRIIDSNCDYEVAKVAANNVEAVLFLQSRGFTFIESNIQLEKVLESQPTIPAIFSRYEQMLTIKPADENETKTILNQIKKGEVFTTDKIAVDPRFGPKFSGNRYFNWSTDLLNNGCVLNAIYYRNSLIGFSICVEKEGFFDAFLGGLCDKKYIGFGFAPIFSNLLFCYNNGGRIIRTGVSSNNLPILKLHILYGFTITSINYVFVRHNKELVE